MALVRVVRTASQVKGYGVVKAQNREAALAKREGLLARLAPADGWHAGTTPQGPSGGFAAGREQAAPTRSRPVVPAAWL